MENDFLCECIKRDPLPHNPHTGRPYADLRKLMKGIKLLHGIQNK